MSHTRSFVFFIILIAAAPALAEVRLPAIISDHMVLQADAAAPVWGWAGPGETVTVAIAGQTRTAQPDASGKWMVRLDKMQPGGPHTLTVTGKNTLTVNDVLVGEVWLCSGQSNMDRTVENTGHYAPDLAAANFPQLREFKVAKARAKKPQADCQGHWELCSPGTAKGFSGTAFFFGRELHQKLNRPVGLVVSAVGSTRIEVWFSQEAQHKNPELNAHFWGASGNLFYGMIAPLVPYALRGAVWYQGESNCSAPDLPPLYSTQLTALIGEWRALWGQGDFPFAWVQLANTWKKTPEPVQNGNWPLVREAMLKTLSVPNTGMAVTIDTGNGNIHPQDKLDAGRRLALWALGSVYGQQVATSGPLPAGHDIHGSEVVLSFSHTDGGLVAKGGALKGFAIAGADRQWHFATAKIDGDKVIVSSDAVQQPIAVRYAWADNPDCSLYNGAGLPASPFRTDDWSDPVAPPQAPAPATAQPPA